MGEPWPTPLEKALVAPLCSFDAIGHLPFPEFQQVVRTIIEALGIRETCQRCVHKEDVPWHDRFSVAREQHPYAPMLVVHLDASRDDVSRATDTDLSGRAGPEGAT